MAYTTELTEDFLGIVHVGSGVVTSQELLAGSVAARRLVQSTENFNYELVDLSAVSELRTKASDLKEIVAQDRIAAESRPHMMIVVVAPHDHSYEVAQEWKDQVQELGWTIHISRERSEALEWLRNHREEARRDLLAEKEKTADCE